MEKESQRMKQDLLFEALAEVCGLDWARLTKTERGRLQAATKELRDVQATPEDIRGRAKQYAVVFKGAILTPQGLTGNWGLLAPKDAVGKPLTKRSPEEQARLEAHLRASEEAAKARTRKRLGLDEEAT